MFTLLSLTFSSSYCNRNPKFTEAQFHKPQLNCYGVNELARIRRTGIAIQAMFLSETSWPSANT